MKIRLMCFWPCSKAKAQPDHDPEEPKKGSRWVVEAVLPIVFFICCLHISSMRYALTLRTPLGTNVTTQGGEQQERHRIQRLPINPNSTMAADILDIRHDPNEGAICIHLSPTAQCPYPTWQGRLSGPSLAILEWQVQKEQEKEGVVHCGSYNEAWLPAGEYFVEVIVLYCNDFGVGALERTKESDWLSYKFEKKCVQDPTSFRISKNNAKIDIPSTKNGSTGAADQHKRILGHWVNKNKNSVSQNPLYTRYQGQGCRREPSLPRCLASSDASGFSDYSFEWRDNLGNQWFEKLGSMVESSTKVCLVGFSHSRHLRNAMRRLGLSKFFYWMKAHFLRDVNEALLKDAIHKRGCDQFLIGIAQWPGSLHTSFKAYSVGFRRILQLAQKFEGARFYFRSIHLNPIGEDTGSCRPRDWRTPPVMDGYSHVIAQAINASISSGKNETFVRFVDTRFVTSPMWDSAVDWRHLPSYVSDVEALYLAAVLLLRIQD
eukprot:scaffold9278_cov170-Cylindrotheca_fusiformis.AAC.6